MNSYKQWRLLCGGLGPEHLVSVHTAWYLFESMRSSRNLQVCVFGACGELLSQTSLEKTLGEIQVQFQTNWDPSPFLDACIHKADWWNDDALFVPLFHGRPGEDGSVQGLLDWFNKPYLGTKGAGLSLCLDKVKTKKMAAAAGIPVTPYYVLDQANPFSPQALEQIFEFPVFVKPVDGGSSLGVSFATNREELVAAVRTAYGYSQRAVIEPAQKGREVSIAFLEGHNPFLSCLGGLSLSWESFQFEDKYGPNSQPDLIPYPVPASKEKLLRQYAESLVSHLELRHWARIDFFETNEGWLLNEVNAIPGLGPHSLYNQLWAEQGLPIDKAFIHLESLQRSST